MRNATEVQITEYATDSGPVCPHCDSTLWSYRLYGAKSIATGDADSGNEPVERNDHTSTFVARCASCHCAESWDSRGLDAPETVQLVREEHEWRRKLVAEGRPYALARTFVIRHPLPSGNLLVLAFSRNQAEAIALFQLIGGPVKYVHADDPLDWTIGTFGTVLHDVPCMECGQDVATADCLKGWGFVQLHEECKHTVRRKDLTDMTRRIEAGF